MTTLKSRVGVLLITCLGVMHAQAQDVHFSMFHLAPLTLNPAQAGAIDHDHRAVINYRDQWTSFGSPFRTYAASYDLPLLQGKLKGKHFGVGVHAFRDKGGTSGLGDTEAALSIAYEIRATRLGRISVGLQGGYGQRSAMLSELRWDNQFSGSNFDPTAASGENGFDETSRFIDLAAGVLWRGVLAGSEFSAGAAVFHAHEPIVSFLGTTNDRLLRRYVVHAQTTIEADKWNYLPMLYVQKQGGAQELMAGGFVQRRLGMDSRHTTDKTSNAFYLGAFYRYADAIIPAMQFEWHRTLTIAMSYDVNVSKLKAHTNYQGGYEIALKYHRPLSDRRRKLNGPPGM